MIRCKLTCDVDYIVHMAFIYSTSTKTHIFRDEQSQRHSD